MTSKGSRRGSGRKRASAPIDAPFEARLFADATALARRYRLILVQEDEGYVARASELPGVSVRGASPNECADRAREALAVTIATMLELGEKPPLPAGERRAQVNIRLSPAERALLDAAAQDAGFKGLGAYIRAIALGAIRGAEGPIRMSAAGRRRR